MINHNIGLIAIDVDLTVVDTLTPWMKDFTFRTGMVVENKDRVYDLVPEMINLIDKSTCLPFDPLVYWRDPNLYLNLRPITDSVAVINKLIDAGYEVIFVSSCFHEHTRSKEEFLDKFFPRHSGFISTHDKQYVGYDFIIDDRLKHMILGMKHRPGAHHILFTGVRADGYEYERSPYINCDSWQSVLNFFFKYSK